MSIEDDLTVAVDGHLKSTTLPIQAALTTLWQTVRELPIGEYQLRAMHQLLGSGDTRPIERFLAGEGATDWPLDLTGGGRVTVRVSRGDGLTTSQRIAARYTPEQQQGHRRGSGPWAIRDSATKGLVRDDGEILLFPIKDSAQAWIGRQVNLAGYRSSRHLAAK
ncbi:hypothetical protein [Kitasatospora aureofaciens]|uniref:hypothetical protein n=1 Tax=Kitasatospora aureofaciens TaxID=1894 RepID=UPI001C486AB0|nr:hypothetical protein [Kitasatospora aureofaciens]MBV6699328.1 hypothetical protein [Kitasatospora aureofaciens]